MAQKFKTGDTVQLKSGGPEMTVKSYDAYIDTDLNNQVSDSQLTCQWFEKSELKSASFDQDTLDSTYDGEYPIA